MDSSLENWNLDPANAECHVLLRSVYGDRTCWTAFVLGVRRALFHSSQRRGHGGNADVQIELEIGLQEGPSRSHYWPHMDVL